MDGFGDGVQIPAQNALGRSPTRLALQHLLDGRWFFAVRRVVRSQRSEDVINGFERGAHHTCSLWRRLRHQQKSST
jgi:hypothetical protein